MVECHPGLKTFAKAIELAKRGVEEDNKKNFKEAIKLYEECQGYFLYAIKYEVPTQCRKNKVYQMIETYNQRANILKMQLIEKEKLTLNN